MDLKLIEEVPKLPLSLKVMEKDSPNTLYSLYNKDKIFDRAMVNVVVAGEENDDISTRKGMLYN